MAGSPGIYYYDVDASAIGLTPVSTTSGTGSANTAALQAALGTLDTGLDKPILVRFTGGPYYFNGVVDVPCERQVEFDLCGATLVNLHATDSIFRLKLQNDTGWYDSRFVLRNGIITGTGPALTSHNSGSLDPRVAKLKIADVQFSTTKRPVEVTMGYTVNPLIQDCQFTRNASQEGGIYWAPGRAENHGSSMMRIFRCHFNMNSNRKYPAIWMSGARGLEIDSCIFEGHTGFAGGATPADFERALGIYLTNWGFYQTVFRHNWFEYVDFGTRNTDYNIVINNPTSGNMGVDAPANVVIEHADPSYIKVMNHSGSYHPFTVFIDRPIHAVIRQTQAGISHNGPCRVVVTGGPVDSQALSVDTDPNQLLQKETSGPGANGTYQANWYEAGPEPLYVYPGGGSGYDGSGITAGSISTYPHKHPVYGPCLALRGYGYGLNVPVGRRPDGIRTLHTRVRICSPNHVLQGGSAPGLWAVVQCYGEASLTRMVPAGYAPTELSLGTATAAGFAQRGLSLENWWSTYPGGAYGTPTSPWLLVYGMSAAYYKPLPLEPKFPLIPVQFLEWTAGAGPPAGTYEFGDKVLTLNGGLPYVCDQPGTSRTISKTCNTTSGSAVLTNITNAGDILEGDYLTLSGVARGRVLTVASNGNVTLDTTVSTTLTGTALTNKTPSFARRRV